MFHIFGFNYNLQIDKKVFVFVQRVDTIITNLFRLDGSMVQALDSGE